MKPQPAHWRWTKPRRLNSSRAVAVRLLRGGDQGVMPVEEFVREALQDVARKAPLASAPAPAS